MEIDPRLRASSVACACVRREARVAALAAEGRSNREVAQSLFVSIKTVEANLSRVYAKLGVRSRAALAATRMAESGRR